MAYLITINSKCAYMFMFTSVASIISQSIVCHSNMTESDHNEQLFFTLCCKFCEEIEIESYVTEYQHNVCLLFAYLNLQIISVLLLLSCYILCMIIYRRIEHTTPERLQCSVFCLIFLAHLIVVISPYWHCLISELCSIQSTTPLCYVDFRQLTVSLTWRWSGLPLTSMTETICMVQRILFYSIITVMWSTPMIGSRTDPFPSVHGRPAWTHRRYGSSSTPVCGRHTDLQILCSWWSLCSSAAHLNLCRPNIGMDEGEPPAAELC